MNKRRWIRRLVLLVVLVTAAVIGFDQRMILRRYSVKAGQLDQPIRMAVLTDYHGCGYGENGTELVAEVTAIRPDMILLVGDMFSADGDPEAELAMFRALADVADTYYVTGNHEYWEQDVPALLAKIHQSGVTVLHASSVTVEVNGARVVLCGIPDPYDGGDTEAYLARAAAGIDPEAYTILLAHRPEVIGKYAATGNFDLVLSGHAHGGQVRIPLLVHGLCAPNQGWFPKYAGGRYEVSGTTMIVSRGLSTQRQMGIPRIFNRPELLLVELQ